MRYILIHGLGQDASSWDKTINCMGEKFSVSCPDLFRLLSGKNSDYINLYRAFNQYCQQFTEPVSLCGISLGAVLALNYALDQPEKVSSVILIGAQYKMPKLLLGIQNVIFQFMPKTSFVKLGLDKKSLIQLSKSMVTLDFSKRLPDLRCDALILCGDKDKANKKAAQELARYLSEAELQVIAGAGHEVNLEAPEKLADIITGFWNKKP